jgi:hypothetical protein
VKGDGEVRKLYVEARRRAGNTVSCLSVTVRRGRLRYLGVLGSAALAAAVVLGGCSSPAAASKTVSGSEHSLTLAEARAVFNSYVTTSTAAAKQGNATQGLEVVGDAQWAIMHAQYTALATAGTQVAQYSYGTPTFYVPTLAGYPLWFVVAVPVSASTDGHLGPAVTTLMVFQRYVASREWTLGGSAVLDQPLPAIALDGDGYATAFTNTDPTLLLPPDIVGPTQAAVVDQGPTAPAAAVMDGGPQTTALYAAQAARGKSASANGLNYQWLLEGASFAQYELRTADGGALVLYSMYLNTTTEHPGNAAGSPIPVPAEFTPLLAAPSQVGYRQVTANWTYEFAAVDPPQTAHGAKVEVIGGTGAPTYGSAR